MTSAIETSGLTKTYGAVTAVAGLDLRVEPGQIFAFLGPNGAGKSTTIRMLLALQWPTAGHACVLGLDSQADRVEIHRRVGYLPGDLALFPRLSGRRHLDWFAAPGETPAPGSPRSWCGASTWSSTGPSGSSPRATGRRSGSSWRS